MAFFIDVWGKILVLIAPVPGQCLLAQTITVKVMLISERYEGIKCMRALAAIWAK